MEQSRMTEDDVLFGYRLQLFALAAERGVSEACRLMGVHRSTYYRWKHQVGRSGLEMLRPRMRTGSVRCSVWGRGDRSARWGRKGIPCPTRSRYPEGEGRL